MFETLLAGFGLLFVYKFAHDFMLNRMIADAKKKPVSKPEPHVSQPTS